MGRGWSRAVSFAARPAFAAACSVGIILVWNGIDRHAPADDEGVKASKKTRRPKRLWLEICKIRNQFPISVVLHHPVAG